MSRTLLFECSPRRPADGVVVPLRLAFKCVGPATHLGVQWEPLVEAPPTFESAIGFDGRDLGASPIPQVGELVFAMTDRTRAAAGLVWKNAVVTIKMALWGAGGARPADGDFTTVWTGYADDIAVAAGRARVTMIDAGQLLRSAVIITKFGSSGDALLDSADALKDRSPGTVVPQAWGRVLSIPGLLVDRANGIWLFANSPAASVQGFYDGGAAFTLGTARASLAALQANVPATGAVDYCLNSAGKLLARPWSAPTYPFTAAATFGASNKIADIASAIVSARGGPAFKAGAVAAFNGVMAADAGLYLDDDTTIAAALDRLFNGVGAWWKLTSAGTIDCRQLGFATPVFTVAAHRRGAPERQRIVVPTASRSLGYARNDRVHSEGEIAAIILAGDLAYADGTPVEALKPAEPGATLGANPGNLDVQIGGGNLLQNASFEVGTLGFGGYNNSPGTEPFTGLGASPGNGRDGGAAFFFEWGVTNTTVKGFYLDGANSGRMLGGRIYVFSFWAKLFSASGLMSFSLAWNIPPAAIEVLESPGLTTLWQRCSWRITWGASVDPNIFAGITQAVTGGVFVDDVQLEEGNYPTEFAFRALEVRRIDPVTGQGNSLEALPAFVGWGAGQLVSVNPLSATESGGVASIHIAAHDVFSDIGTTISFPAQSPAITGLALSTLYYVYEDNAAYAGGSRSYVATTTRSALARKARLVGTITTPAAAAGSTTGGGGGVPGGGWSGGGDLP